MVVVARQAAGSPTREGGASARSDDPSDSGDGCVDSGAKCLHVLLSRPDETAANGTVAKGEFSKVMCAQSPATSVVFFCGSDSQWQGEIETSLQRPHECSQWIPHPAPAWFLPSPSQQRANVCLCRVRVSE